MAHPYLIDPGGETDTNAVLLGTLGSRHIRNEKRPEWRPDELRAAVQMCLRDFPNIVFRSATAIYNCVGMVFATRRTWVDPEYVPRLLTDDNYRTLSLDDAQIGDIAVYKSKTGEVTHVGVIIQRIEDIRHVQVTFRILSKWGPWAEFIHEPLDVYASYGTIAEVWTDRKQP